MAVVVIAAAGCSSPSSDGDDSNLNGKTVNVIGTWGGDEQAAFLTMVKPWEDQTGAKVKYTGTRDINTVLTTGVASGVLPDLAGLPGPGQMAEYAKAGALMPLDDVLDSRPTRADTAPALVELGKTDGKVYGVFIKAAIKGLIWYNPKLHDYSANPPKTWTDLMSQATANQGSAKAVWCLGIESGAASGWPGTDWIEDLVLRTAGPDVYTQWYQGKVKWSDPAIKNAFQMYAHGRSRQDVRRRADRGRPPTSATPATRCSPARPAASSCTRRASSPGSASSSHTRLARTTTSSRSPTSTRSTRVRSRAPATCSACSTTPRPRGR